MGAKTICTIRECSPYTILNFPGLTAVLTAVVRNAICMPLTVYPPRLGLLLSFVGISFNKNIRGGADHARKVYCIRLR